MSRRISYANLNREINMDTPELVKNWYCPSCHLSHRSKGSKTAFHNCSAINGAFIPLLLEGVDATNRILLREDYVGEDICSVRDKNNRVIMSVSQEMADGSNALTVFVPCATTDLRGHDNGVD